MADALLNACEAQAMPKDMVGLTRLARALIVIDRLLTALYAEKPVRAKTKAVAEPAPAAAKLAAPVAPSKAPDLTSQMTALLAAKKQSDAVRGPRRGYG